GDQIACEQADHEPVALELDPQYWLMQNAASAGSAPTKENYARALKLTTLAMILAQMEHHKQIMGNTSPISIPNACRNRLDGDLPEKIPVRPIDPALLEDRFDALMEANGLSQLSPEYNNALATQDIGDPKNKGFLGYSPFEKLHAAEAGIAYFNSQTGTKEPAIDDRDGYDKTLQIKAGSLVTVLEAVYPLREVDTPGYRNSTSYPVYVRPPEPSAAQKEQHSKKLAEEKEKLFSLLQQEDDMRTLGPVPKALIERMDRQNAADWREVVPEKVRKQLQSTRTNLPFPPAHSPPGYRSWAIQESALTLERMLPRLKAIERMPQNQQGETDRAFLLGVIRACNCYSPGKPSRPASAFLEETLSKIQKYRLVDRTLGDSSGKFSREELRLLEVHLPALWKELSDFIPAAHPTEWEFLGSQIGSNPFAGLKLEALIQKHEAHEMKDSKKARILDSTLKEFKLDQPLSVFLPNQILSRSEKKKLWTSIRDDHDSSNYNLFLQKGWGEGLETSTRYYEQIEKIASTRLLDRESALEAANACHLDRPIGNRPSYSQEVDEIFNSDEGQKADLLKRIYEARGNPKEQDRLFKKYSQEFEADPRDAGREARKALLDMDSSIKRPLYKSLIQRAATRRYAELTAALSALCSLKPDDHEKFKQLVLSTMKAQDALNEQLGLPGMPESARAEMDRLSAQDWKELKLSGLALGLFVGASVLLSFSTGGLAVPAVAAAATALSGAMAIGSVAVGAVAIPKMWLNELPNAEERARYSAAFQDLRLTNQESVEKLQGEVTTMKRWGVGANILFSLPMIKPTAQFVQTSARGVSLLARATTAGAGTAERLAFRQAASKAHQEAEAITAEYVFGYRTLSKEMISPTKFATQVWNEAAKPLQLSVTSTEQLAQDSAKLYSAHFKNDPSRLKGFLESMKSKLSRGASSNSHFGPQFWRRSILKKQKMVEQIDELLLALKHDSMEDVLVKKGADFSELIENLPRGKADMAAMFTIEGIPGLNTPLLRLKEISAARSALLRQLGDQAATSAGKPSPARSQLALLKEFREQLGSQGKSGETQWSAIRAEIQRNIGAKSPEMVDQILKDGRVELPVSAWKGPTLASAIQQMEERARLYSNLNEFDEWLAIKRLQKQVSQSE
ncbi:MAG: hypothetical protein KGQ59_09860, partial [Bdellovibrionales bacterium]|nr:hypothetical protein [Bdellovibrionales bacterium]